jgi:hypothetical protein
MRTPFANLELLRALAQAGRGSTTDLAGFPKLIDRLRTEAGETSVLRSTSFELWTSPWVFGLFALFLCGEWILRRRHGFF